MKTWLLVISGVQKPFADNRKAQLADTSAKLYQSMFFQLKHENKLSANLHKLGGTTQTNCKNGVDVNHFSAPFSLHTSFTWT